MMEEDISEYSIGVVVARLQVHELHEGHHHIIKQVVENHKKAIIFLGVPKFTGTRRNPLDFDTRKKMVQTDYPDAVILAIPDQSDNSKWSSELDKRIREIYQHGEVLIYGGRDSFIPHYINGGGRFKTKELKNLGTFAGTNIRKIVSEEVKNSKDFRSGVIYHAYNLFPRIIPTINVIPYNEDRSEILLARKYDDAKWRFIGGFLKTEDSDLEMASRRILTKEAGRSIATDEYKFLSSMTIDDWRFRNEDDKVITTIFTCQYQWGIISPEDDIMEIKWFKISELKEDIFIEEHKPIFSKINK